MYYNIHSTAHIHRYTYTQTYSRYRENRDCSHPKCMCSHVYITLSNLVVPLYSSCSTDLYSVLDNELDNGLDNGLDNVLGNNTVL